MSNQQPLVGTWEGTVPEAEGNPNPTFEAVFTFFADGNMITTSSLNPVMNNPGRGVWIEADNTYLGTFVGFIFDEQGKANGKAKVHLSIKMDGRDHFKGHYVVDAIDLAGKVTKKVSHGPFEGTRMEVELS